MCNCEWQPIETAPKDGSPFLTFLPPPFLYCIAEYSADLCGFIVASDPYEESGYLRELTVWAPLLAAQKPGESKEVA